MEQQLKHLPADYRQQIAKELGCSASMVGEVKRQVEHSNSVRLNSTLKVNILKAMKRLIDEGMAAQRLLTS